MMKIDKYKSSNPKMTPTDWVIYFIISGNKQFF